MFGVEHITVFLGTSRFCYLLHCVPEGNKSIKPMSYLPSRLDTFPHTKVTDDPGQQKAQSQLPSNIAQLIDASSYIQNSSPAVDS